MAPIYFSYGMTKSGSTLGFELVRTALDFAGLNQPLAPPVRMAGRKINFVGHLDTKLIRQITDFAQQIGHTLAFKTHTRPDPGVVELLQAGRATAHAIFRDPRDIALSMLDHGRKARARCKKPFAEFVTIEDTINPIRHQTNSLLAWLSLPNVRPLFYDNLAFDTASCLRRLLGDLNIEVDPGEIIEEVCQNRFTQRNVARQSRYITEMDADTSARFRAIFAPFYERLIDRAPHLSNDGAPLLDPKLPLCHWEEPARA